MKLFYHPKFFLQKVERCFLFGLFILSFLGMLDAAYLTLKHFTPTPVVCTIFHGCEIVLRSSYAVLGSLPAGRQGIPVALLGLLYYLFLFVLGLIAIIPEKRTKVLYWVRGISVIGFLASMWFLYVQTFILRAFCFWCLISASISMALFLGSLVFFVFERTQQNSS